MSNPDDHACLQGALVQEGELPVAPEGLSTRVQIYRSGFKDPLLARWDPRPGDPAGEPTWAVATNLLAKFHPEVSDDDANQILHSFLAAEPHEVNPLPPPKLFQARSLAADPAQATIASPLARMRELSQHPAVARVSPDYLYFSIPLETPPAVAALDEEALSLHPELTLMGAGKLQQRGVISGSPAVVAVLDTGIAIDHPLLKNNILRDANGKVVGANFHDDPAAGNGSVQDNHFHGTYCAGLIGARGGLGVNQTVSLMPVKFLSSEGCGRTSDAVKGIDFALANHADVISCSWGGTGASPDLEEAIKRAHEKGVLVVAGAGNGQRFLDDSPFFPAAFALPNVISVGGTDDVDMPVLKWGTGRTRVHLGAPGVTVISTIPPDSHAEHCGTSASAAFVAGACALLKMQSPGLTHLQIRQRVLQSVAPLQGPRRQASCTNGRLDLARMIREENFPPVSC